MLVNSTGKVLNLNADLSYNHNSSTFMGDTTFTVESAVSPWHCPWRWDICREHLVPSWLGLLWGRATNVNPSSFMVESFPQLLQPPIWKARINPRGRPTTGTWLPFAQSSRLLHLALRFSV